MSNLYRLIYASRTRFGDGDAPVIVKDILERSRKNNVALKVTGALFFNETNFAQVLEGERRHVDQTFARIERDPRHQDISVLFREPVPERGFSDWSMALVGTTGYGKALWKALLARNAGQLEHLDGAAVFALLRGLTFEEFAAQVGARAALNG